MRADLIECLETLLDAGEVRRAWVDHDPASGLLRGGWLPAHLIDHIDDCSEFGDPSLMLGVTLRTVAEVALVGALGAAVAPVPVTCEDAETVGSPEWAAMLPAARALLTELRRSDGLAHPQAGSVDVPNVGSAGTE